MNVMLLTSPRMFTASAVEREGVMGGRKEEKRERKERQGIREKGIRRRGRRERREDRIRAVRSEKRKKRRKKLRAIRKGLLVQQETEEPATYEPGGFIGAEHVSSTSKLVQLRNLGGQGTHVQKV